MNDANARKWRSIRFGTLLMAIPMTIWFFGLMYFAFQIREVTSYLIVFASTLFGSFCWAYIFYMLFRKDKGG